ncbi:MAG: sugar transferase [Verrucomicrobia bacterium]|nr:sugar transferase [Verrucomicrobiota bacterium]
MAKRLFDVALASFGLLLLLPVGLLIALLIKLADGGPVFYRQVRIGQFGRPFPIWKFRSMVRDADKLGLPVTRQGDARITRIGRLLRRTKLDELPQLWNVLVGEMSFVGPRPEVARYVEHYTPEQREILRLKPGITDLASVLFRNEEELLRGSKDVEGFYVQHCLPKKIDLNRRYAERASLLQDIWIIVQTLCPYWLGVLAVYGITLTASLFLAYQLRFDFDLPRQDFDDFLRVLPWMVTPQLVLLFWRGQFRGLLSYFSIPELKQIATALILASFVQVALWKTLPVSFLPARSILPLDFLLSLIGLCGVRLFFRFLRERAFVPGRSAAAPPWRIAIVGTGELATNLALDLGRSRETGKRVVAFFDDDPHSWRKRPHDIPVVGMPECILNGEWLAQLDEVIVALPEAHATRAREIGDLLQGSRLRVSFASTWPVVRPVPN